MNQNPFLKPPLDSTTSLYLKTVQEYRKNFEQFMKVFRNHDIERLSDLQRKQDLYEQYYEYIEKTNQENSTIAKAIRQYNIDIM